MGESRRLCRQNMRTKPSESDEWRKICFSLLFKVDDCVRHDHQESKKKQASQKWFILWPEASNPMRCVCEWRVLLSPNDAIENLNRFNAFSFPLIIRRTRTHRADTQLIASHKLLTDVKRSCRVFFLFANVRIRSIDMQYTNTRTVPVHDPNTRPYKYVWPTHNSRARLPFLLRIHIFRDRIGFSFLVHAARYYLSFGLVRLRPSEIDRWKWLVIRIWNACFCASIVLSSVLSMHDPFLWMPCGTAIGRADLVQTTYTPHICMTESI